MMIQLLILESSAPVLLFLLCVRCTCGAARSGLGFFICAHDDPWILRLSFSVYGAGTSDEGAFMAVIPAVGCVGHCTYTRIDSLFYYRAKGFRLQAGMSAVAFYRTAKI